MGAKHFGLRVRVERSLRESFLKACRTEDRPAAQVICELMRDYVSRNSPNGRVTGGAGEENFGRPQQERVRALAMEYGEGVNGAREAKLRRASYGGSRPSMSYLYHRALAAHRQPPPVVTRSSNPYDLIREPEARDFAGRHRAHLDRDRSCRRSHRRRSSATPLQTPEGTIKDRLLGRRMNPASALPPQNAHGLSMAMVTNSNSRSRRSVSIWLFCSTHDGSPYFECGGAPASDHRCLRSMLPRQPLRFVWRMILARARPLWRASTSVNLSCARTPSYSHRRSRQSR